MQYRKVKQVVTGKAAVDGAGVHLQRVLGIANVEAFDPFLMLDSFDSYNPNDYVAGFPMHPHRGIETITYLVSGEIEHEDSLGNQGTIGAGASQWMTAGSGIMHQEMPKASNRMLGFQLWLNLPQSEKMTTPKYFDIHPQDIVTVDEDGYRVHILSGAYNGKQGVKSHHIQATILDVELEQNKVFQMPVEKDKTVFVFFLEGQGIVDGKQYGEKSALLLADGEAIEVQAIKDEPLRFAVFAATPLKEGIAWGGPIVMNTREELDDAFAQLRTGTFIKQQPLN